jgi:Leucine-rich repeat (LRR) protein
LRLIYNRIKTIPNEFYQSENMKESLTTLIMNANPLTELSGLIRYLKNLKVLGIAHSKIQELPSSIAYLDLKTIVVENTPLKIPKLVTAERGFKAIKEYFDE